MIEESIYFLTVCRYIVLYPVEARMVTRAGEWLWSSYNDEGEGSRPHLAVRRRSRIHADSLILRLVLRPICDQV